MPEQLTICVCYFEFFAESVVRSEACFTSGFGDALLFVGGDMLHGCNKYVWRKSLYDLSTPCL